MPLFLSHVAVKIRGLCSVYIVYGAKEYFELVFRVLNKLLAARYMEKVQ